MKSILRFFQSGVRVIQKPACAPNRRQGVPIRLECLEDRTLPAAVASYLPATLTPNSNPKGIVLGPDGNYWFTEPNSGRIGRSSPDGTGLMEFALPDPTSSPQGITVGPDGNLWFTETNASKIGRITPAGSITEFALAAGKGPQGITAGPDGNLWFTETTAGAIGRITTAGAVSEFALSTPGSAPDIFVNNAITAGPDGNLWFTEDNANKVGRITTAGVITEFSLTANTFNSSRHPRAITAGPDGDLYVAEAQGGVAQVTTAGAVREIQTAGANSISVFSAITTGPDGNIWAAGLGANFGVAVVSTSGALVARYNFGQEIFGLTRGAADRLVFADLTANQIGVIQGIVVANPSFLQAIYSEALGRAPQANDDALWVNFSETNGVSAEASLIERSSEARFHLVDGWFGQYLGHPATGGQDQFFVNQLLAGSTEEQVLGGLLASQEYYQHAPQVSGVGGGSATDTTFITALFVQLLGRQPTATEVTYWLGQLPTLGRASVAVDFLQSAEFRTIAVRSYYTTLLQRTSAPDPASVQTWVQSGLDLTSIRVAFETSPEFFGLHEVNGLGVADLPGTPTAGAGLQTIVTGPDSNFWFTEASANNIGQVTPAGKLTEFPVPTANSKPTGLTVGPDGNLWFTEQQANKIGRITPSGQITEFGLPTSGSGPSAITAGPDGNLWFLETQVNRIGRISPMGQVAEFNVPTANSGLDSITAGPDGNVWFTETRAAKIGRITPQGAVTEFGTSGGHIPTEIVNGPDGRLYNLESFPDKFGPSYLVGTITPAGATFSYPIPNTGAAGTGGETPAGLTVGPDGNLRITLAGSGSTRGGTNQDLIVDMTTSGTAVTTVFAPNPNQFTVSPSTGPSSITFGPAGTLAFLQSTANRIALIRNAADANQAYIQALFHNNLGTSVAGRAAGTTDLNYWTPILAQSGTQAVTNGIIRSPEARLRLVDSWIALYLGHAPVNGQDQYFVNQLLAGATEEQVLSGLLASSEYYERAPQVAGVSGSPTDATFIQALFLQLLDRQAAQSDVSFWLAQLATLGRAGVALGILQSGEYRAVAVVGYYGTILRRTVAPTSADVMFWVNSGLDLTSIRVGLESSTELYANS